jgi:hypothetical protein
MTAMDTSSCRCLVKDERRDAREPAEGHVGGQGGVGAMSGGRETRMTDCRSSIAAGAAEPPVVSRPVEDGRRRPRSGGSPRLPCSHFPRRKWRPRGRRPWETSWLGIAEPATFAGGTLEVFVADSSLVQELTFQKRQLLGQLQDAAPKFQTARHQVSRRWFLVKEEAGKR